MARKFLQRLLMHGKFWNVIGLAFLPLVIVVAWQFVIRTKAAILPAVLLSPYRSLYPYIMAQAKHETADFTSNVYKRENNLFGFKHANNSVQLGTRGERAPDGGYYQHYSSNFQSIRDYLRYLKAINYPTSVKSPDMFAAELVSRRWFGDGYPGDLEIYTAGIKRYL